MGGPLRHILAERLGPLGMCQELLDTPPTEIQTRDGIDCLGVWYSHSLSRKVWEMQASPAPHCGFPIWEVASRSSTTALQPFGFIVLKKGSPMKIVLGLGYFSRDRNALQIIAVGFIQDF